MTNPIRVLIVDDHYLVRKGLHALLDGRSDFSIVGEASNGQEAIKLVEEFHPDVILLDLIMPVLDGIETIKIIKEQDESARILVVTSFGDDDKVFSAIKAGALGYLLKESSPQELLQAIRAVHRGESSLHPSIALKLVKELHQPPVDMDAPENENTLTERETEVLELLAYGYSNEEISKMIHISKRTVAAHVSNILSKLHVANRTQAALFALRKGIASLDDAPGD